MVYHIYHGIVPGKDLVDRFMVLLAGPNIYIYIHKDDLAITFYFLHTE
jgi:hypothetical protein